MSATQLRAWFSGAWTMLIGALHSVQLTHDGGKYSIERMVALEEYSRNTSLLRVAMVTITPPVLLIAIILGQESVPLQDPEIGWQSHYGFWLRVGVLGAAIAYSVKNQVEPWLGVPGLSWRQTVVYCICVAVGFIASGMFVAEVWVFPVPFFLVSLGVFFIPILLGLFRIVIGGRHFSRILSQREQLRRLSKFASLQGFATMVHPAYQVLFRKASHKMYELPALMALTFFKLIMESIFAVVAGGYKEDLVPGQVVFTVEFFNAFYLATFLPNLSTKSVVVIMTFDLVETAIDLFELHEQMERILSRVRQATDLTNNDNNLLTVARLLCSNPRAMSKQSLEDIQVQSCIVHRVSDEGRTLLQKIHDGFDQLSPARVHIKTTHSVISGSRRNIAAIIPYPWKNEAEDHAQTFHYSTKVVKEVQVLQKILEVLFTSECLVLTEYVECIIPILYGSFLATMVHLPSAHYHMEMVGITRDNVGTMVFRIFVYALLELVSFIALAVIMQRKCGINALYQLAFVLEAQFSLVMSNMMLFITVTLGFRVVHFGSDFSFRFDWIGDHAKDNAD